MEQHDSDKYYDNVFGTVSLKWMFMEIEIPFLVKKK